LALFDRFIHPLRRRAARRRLREVALGDVVFVCQGNLCRSPFAEGVFRGLIAALGVPGVTVQSAGFAPPGRPSPKEAVAAAALFGVDLSRHRSRLVTPDVVRRAAVVVVMSPDQGRWIRVRFGRRAARILMLGDLDPLPIESRTIADPVNQSPQVFEACYARIDRCVHALSRLVTSSPAYASPSR